MGLSNFACDWYHVGVKCVDQAKILSGSRVLVRCDLDVPVKGGGVVEPFRLELALKTLQYIIDQGGLPVICGHMGRPKGKVDLALSTSQLKPYFDKYLKGDFELMENLRFDEREEANDLDFAKELAQKAEIYVNESFATCHRKASSITSLPQLLPGYAGFRLMREVEVLKKVLEQPDRPLVAIIGGAKLESKRPMIEKFAQVADAVLVGGRLALEDPITLEKVYYPVDYVDTKDIGPQTLAGWKDMILSARTIVWAGPMGLFEDNRYSTGTKTVISWLAEATKSGCFTVAGGGDTTTALDDFGQFTNMSFVSSGGGAMLDFLVYGTLPGIEALK